MLRASTGLVLLAVRADVETASLQPLTKGKKRRSFLDYTGRKQPRSIGAPVYSFAFLKTPQSQGPFEFFESIAPGRGLFMERALKARFGYSFEGPPDCGKLSLEGCSKSESIVIGDLCAGEPASHLHW